MDTIYILVGQYTDNIVQLDNSVEVLKKSPQKAQSLHGAKIDIFLKYTPGYRD
jgi:hypothetical protein